MAAFLGLEPTWLEPRKQLRLGSQWTELILNAGSREIRLNGCRGFLGEGVAAEDDTLQLSSVDRDRLLVPILAPQLNPAQSPLQIIAVDAGHGGNDTGTRNKRLKLLEKDFTIDVARRMKPLLEMRGYRVVLTREDDTYVPRAERAARATTADADLFVSVHFNAAGPAHVRGIETYVLTPQFQRSTGSEKLRPQDDVASPGNRHDAWNAYLGYTMHATLLKELELPDRGLKRARFEVLRELSCPGLLVEGGYLSHDEEAKLIATESYREKLAEAIVHGIAVYDDTLRRLAANRLAEGE